LYRESFDFQGFNLPLYNKLNNNEKKRLACTLYYYYITEEDSFRIRRLPTYLNTQSTNPGFNKDNTIQSFYKANSKNINSSFTLLTDFQTVFNIPVNESKKEDKTGVIVGSIIGGIVLIVAIFAYFYFRKTTPTGISTATSTLTSTAPTGTGTGTGTGTAPAPAGAKVSAPAGTKVSAPAGTKVSAPTGTGATVAAYPPAQFVGMYKNLPVYHA
jgi:hypothetical protein